MKPRYPFFILAIVLCPIMTGVFAAPLTEREELTLLLNQLNQIAPEPASTSATTLTIHVFTAISPPCVAGLNITSRPRAPNREIQRRS